MESSSFAALGQRLVDLQVRVGAAFEGDDNNHDSSSDSPWVLRERMHLLQHRLAAVQAKQAQVDRTRADVAEALRKCRSLDGLVKPMPEVKREAQDYENSLSLAKQRARVVHV